MKTISSTIYDRIEYNNKNSYYRIVWYNTERNTLEEVARWRNSYSKESGANYGLLQIWAITFNYATYSTQPGRNKAGGYSKPIANLENCLYDLQKYLKEAHNRDFTHSSCGDIRSLMEELKTFLQNEYKAKLFLDCIG